jgi:glycosyltransferase involved in cell wall biosynthesis
MNRSFFQKLVEKSCDALANVTSEQVEQVPFLKRKYISRFGGMFSKDRKTVDLAFIIPTQSSGWILEAICREISEFVDGSFIFVDDLNHIPPARSYFFAHYYFLDPVLRSCSNVWRSRRGVFFTHPKEPTFPSPQEIFLFNQCDAVFSMCTEFSNLLSESGVEGSMIRTVFGGADPKFFLPAASPGGKVGICSAYYERKNPRLISEVIQLMSDLKFVLVGRNWEQYSGFTSLLRLPNFEYRTLCYKEYPAFYRELKVLLSPGVLEGGPIPLLEAMMCNVMPVAARTGFAPDIIDHGVNGFLFDSTSRTEDVCELIRLATSMTCKARESVMHLDWRRFATQILNDLRVSVKE